MKQQKTGGVSSPSSSSSLSPYFPSAPSPGRRNIVPVVRGNSVLLNAFNHDILPSGDVSFSWALQGGYAQPQPSKVVVPPYASNPMGPPAQAARVVGRSPLVDAFPSVSESPPLVSYRGAPSPVAPGIRMGRSYERRGREEEASALSVRQSSMPPPLSRASSASFLQSEVAPRPGLEKEGGQSRFHYLGKREPQSTSEMYASALSDLLQAAELTVKEGEGRVRPSFRAPPYRQIKAFCLAVDQGLAPQEGGGFSSMFKKPTGEVLPDKAVFVSGLELLDNPEIREVLERSGKRASLEEICCAGLLETILKGQKAPNSPGSFTRRVANLPMVWKHIQEGEELPPHLVRRPYLGLEQGLDLRARSVASVARSEGAERELAPYAAKIPGGFVGGFYYQSQAGLHCQTVALNNYVGAELFRPELIASWIQQSAPGSYGSYIQSIAPHMTARNLNVVMAQARELLKKEISRQLPSENRVAQRLLAWVDDSLNFATFDLTRSPVEGSTRASQYSDAKKLLAALENSNVDRVVVEEYLDSSESYGHYLTFVRSQDGRGWACLDGLSSDQWTKPRKLEEEILQRISDGRGCYLHFPKKHLQDRPLKSTLKAIAPPTPPFRFVEVGRTTPELQPFTFFEKMIAAAKDHPEQFFERLKRDSSLMDRVRINFMKALNHFPKVGEKDYSGRSSMAAFMQAKKIFQASHRLGNKDPALLTQLGEAESLFVQAENFAQQITEVKTKRVMVHGRMVVQKVRVENPEANEAFLKTMKTFMRKMKGLEGPLHHWVESQSALVSEQSLQAAFKGVPEKLNPARRLFLKKSLTQVNQLSDSSILGINHELARLHLIPPRVLGRDPVSGLPKLYYREEENICFRLSDSGVRGFL